MYSNYIYFLLVPGENSSDDSSEAVEAGRNTRNMRSNDGSDDDSSEADLEPARGDDSSAPSLEAPRGVDSSSDGSSSGEPPILVARPQLQDSSDSSSTSDDDVPGNASRLSEISCLLCIFIL